MESLAEAATATAWPLALMFACAAIADRRRQSRRRRALNRALHELRRPLQALLLTGSPGPTVRDRGGVDHLDLALAALDDLDAEINGSLMPATRQPIDARRLLADAAARWQAPAAMRGRELAVRPPGGNPVIHADHRAISRALDNLIVNSLDHGASRILIAARIRRDKLRIAVADGSGGEKPSPRAPARIPNGTDPRRGHGLAVVARIAADHGGRFVLRRGGDGSLALLELPLAASELASHRAG